MNGLVIRDLVGMGEFRLAEDLQNDVWGKDDTADPADLMMVIQAEGGLCAGAFNDGRLVGYVFAFPTRDPEIQHSHRLAIRSETRGLGLGARLKWYQRDWCLARGIRLVRWTFDPLRLLNASLNVGALGAVCRTYYPDYYGAMAGINAGAPSDRLLAEWFLDSPRVAARAAGQSLPATEVASRIALPTEFAAMLDRDPETAIAERLRQRAQISAAFARGEEISGIDRGRGEYLLTLRDSASQIG